MYKSSRKVTDADVAEEFEVPIKSLKECAKKATTIPCNKEWLRTIYRLLNKEHLRDFPEVANVLKLTEALNEYADGNFEYEPEDDILYSTTENMRRVIQSSYEKSVRRSMTNQRNARRSQRGKKDDSQEYDPEPEDDEEMDGEWTENAANASNRTQSHAIADYNNNIEKETIEIEKGTIEKESKERKKNKPTTTNSSSGKFSLSVSKAIEILERYNVKNCDFALRALENDREETGLTPQEENLAIVLYFLTGKTKSNISRITNLMDEAVSKGAREHDTWSEVFNLALRASGQERDFKDKEKCRIMTGSIVNRLREIVEEQSRTQPTRLAVVPRPQQVTKQPQQPQPVEETQRPSLATPQETPAEQSPQDNSQQMAQTNHPQLKNTVEINPAFLRGETDVPF